MFRWIRHILNYGNPEPVDHADHCRKREAEDMDRLISQVTQFRDEVRKFNIAAQSLRENLSK